MTTNTTTAIPLESIAAIKKAARLAGSHFFDPGSMRFFSSRISGHVVHLKESTVGYFITSEENEPTPEGLRLGFTGTPRAYSVRRASYDDDGRFNIETVGEFMGHATYQDARKTAIEAAKTEVA